MQKTVHACGTFPTVNQSLRSVLSHQGPHSQLLLCVDFLSVFANAGVVSSLMENMMKDPAMQKMMYPYLPEGMRNPAAVEQMLKDPRIKKQMEDAFASNVSVAGAGFDDGVRVLARERGFEEGGDVCVRCAFPHSLTVSDRL